MIADEAHLVETCAQRFTFHKVLDARTVPELCAIIEQDPIPFPRKDHCHGVPSIGHHGQ
jgi:hypothetical protein